MKIGRPTFDTVQHVPQLRDDVVFRVDLKRLGLGGAHVPPEQRPAGIEQPVHTSGSVGSGIKHAYSFEVVTTFIVE